MRAAVGLSSSRLLRRGAQIPSSIMTNIANISPISPSRDGKGPSPLSSPGLLHDLVSSRPLGGRSLMSILKNIRISYVEIFIYWNMQFSAVEEVGKNEGSSSVVDLDPSFFSFPSSFSSYLSFSMFTSDWEIILIIFCYLISYAVF